MLEGSGVSQQGSKLVKDGVQVIQGTPKEPITRATLFLRLWRVPGPKKTEVTRATLSMVGPYRLRDQGADPGHGARPAGGPRQSDRDREARRRCYDLPQRRPRAASEAAARRDGLTASPSRDDPSRRRSTGAMPHV